jgi:hypothetical protein
LATHVLNTPPECRLGEGAFRVEVDLCNKAIQNRFSSKYELSLFENCIRYVAMAG